MAMDAGSSHTLPSASWRPKKASDVIQSESECLQTKGINGLHPSPRVGEDDLRCPNMRQAESKNWQIPLLSAFCFIKALNGLAMPINIGKGNLLH